MMYKPSKKWKIRDEELFYDGRLEVISEDDSYEVGRMNPDLAKYIVEIHNKSLEAVMLKK